MLGITPELPKFSIGILLTLLVILGASGIVLRALVRRATTQRYWIALSEWAKRNRFQLSGETRTTLFPPELPSILAKLSDPPPKTGLYLKSPQTTIMQLRPQGPANAGAPEKAANLLVRQIESTWAPTALCPTKQPSALLDALALTAYPTLAAPDRFTVLGTEFRSARAVAVSSLVALLPPNIALLLHGQLLVLDFSQRPFDGLELSRILALADQIVAHLPAK